MGVGISGMLCAPLKTLTLIDCPGLVSTAVNSTG